MDHYDALIVGGSYAGLSGAVQVARSGRPVAVVDSGQPRNRFAAHSHGFFGQDGQSPRQMLAQARADLTAYPNVTFYDTRAVAAQADGDGFQVTLASGKRLRGQRLLLATGVVDVLPDVPGVAERWGTGVLHCPYCHGYEVRGQPLGVLATSPNSAHQALLISDWGPVTFFLNGHVQPDALTLARFAARGITLEPTPLLGLEGAAPGLDGVRLTDGRLVPLGALFVATRLRPASDLAEQLGCAFEEGPQGPLVTTDAGKQTSVPGVYAAGDQTPRVGNALLAAADGAWAGVSLHQSLIFGSLSGVAAD